MLCCSTHIITAVKKIMELLLVTDIGTPQLLFSKNITWFFTGDGAGVGKGRTVAGNP